jgi:hypothetical protein
VVFNVTDYAGLYAALYQVNLPAFLITKFYLHA